MNTCGDHGVPEGATDNACPNCGENFNTSSDTAPEREQPSTWRRDDLGRWHEAEPLGWQEEHPRLVRAVYRLLGISHCGKRGWRS